jgi:hypothetical protein
LSGKPGPDHQLTMKWLIIVMLFLAFVGAIFTLPLLDLVIAPLLVWLVVEAVREQEKNR